jgi:hypothetical protein
LQLIISHQKQLKNIVKFLTTILVICFCSLYILETNCFHYCINKTDNTIFISKKNSLLKDFKTQIDDEEFSLEKDEEESLCKDIALPLFDEDVSNCKIVCIQYDFNYYNESVILKTNPDFYIFSSYRETFTPPPQALT